MFKKKDKDLNISDSESLLNDNQTKNEEEKYEDTACETAEADKQLEDSIKAELETVNNQYIRLAADFDNYRKRHAQERECLLKYGAEDTLKKLLPILDTFDMAKNSMEQMDDPEKIKENFNVVQKQFSEALEKIGLQKIEAEGKEFDPNLHEAVMQTPNNDVADHTVISELQKGYMLHDRVLRPSMVNVAVND